MKHNCIHILGVPEGEESEPGIENLFEEMVAENLPNLVKESHTNLGGTQSAKHKNCKEAQA